MKVLIAYDGSGYAHNALNDLRGAGLPDNADVLMISVSEVWLPPQAENNGDYICLDKDAVAYFQMRSEQMERNLGESREILIEAKEELKKQFPNWAIQAESITGSPTQTLLKKAATFAPDLIVVGPRGLSSDGETGLGSVAQNVLSYSHFPVRIGRGNSERDAGQLRIAIGFDGSAGSLEAVKTVASREWDGRPEFRLFVVTDPLIALIPGRVFRLIPGVPEGRMKGEEQWVKTLTDEALGILGTSSRKASVHNCSGNPRIMLVNETKEWCADTIFVGMNSRQSHLLGCVASAVAARSSCSVEVVSKTADRVNMNSYGR